MKTVVEFPDKGVLSEQAAEWLIRLDADSPPSRQELRALGEWLHRSPAHREELEKLALLWGRMNILTELAVRKRDPQDIARPPRGAPATTGRGRRLRQAGIAAVVVGAFAFGLLWFARESADESVTATNGLYATAVGQQSTTELPDGSQIVLNTDSQIRVNYGERFRQVHLLQGEALFTVAKDPRRPFRVYAGSGRIEAVGTSFSVYLHGGEAQVTVAEGRVALASVDMPRMRGASGELGSRQAGGAASSGTSDETESVQGLGTLSAGQVGTIRNLIDTNAAAVPMTLTGVTPLTPAKLAERLAWRDGILRFSGESLEDVVREVSRYTTVSIEIPDPAVRDMRIGGRFPVGETDVMLAALQSSFNLRVTHLGRNRIVLTAADE